MNIKKCPVCGKTTRYQESDQYFEYWYSLCEHITDYKIDRNTDQEVKEDTEYPCAECGTLCEDKEMIRPVFSSQFFCSAACVRAAETRHEGEE